MLTPQAKGSFPPRYTHFRHQPQFWAPFTSDWAPQHQGLLTTHLDHLLGWFLELRKALHLWWLVHCKGHRWDTAWRRCTKQMEVEKMRSTPASRSSPSLLIWRWVGLKVAFCVPGQLICWPMVINSNIAQRSDRWGMELKLLLFTQLVPLAISILKRFRYSR